MVRQRDEGKEDDTLCLRTRGEQDVEEWVGDRQRSRRSCEFGQRQRGNARVMERDGR